ncbi:recombinase [Niallia circulans]|uniref:Recombinase n=1 Tax=Niallia circulans TaxID=1397 RepID=A0A553SQ08_NIACI|nr:tyrosine-type recombinase/integrase [Niallia circulans]TRZ39081.1 recombinase [Niallia circulans]
MVKDLQKEFKFDLEIKNYSKRTIATYNYNIDQLMTYLEEHFGFCEIEEISTMHIKRFVQQQLHLGNKSNYINTIIKSLRAFYNYLVAEEYVSHNIVEKVKFLKEEKVIIKTFTDKEVANMIDAYDFKTYLNARNKVIIAMFIDTGMRMSELINLQSSWFNETNIKVFGKGAKWRYVPVSLMLKKYMIRYERLKEGYFKNKRKEYDNYFLSRSGKPLTGVQIQNIVRNAGAKAKVREEIRCSPHTLRHFSIQSNLRNGLDLYSCSRIAGHENIQITKKYLMGLETENILEMATKSSPLMNIKNK